MQSVGRRRQGIADEVPCESHLFVGERRYHQTHGSQGVACSRKGVATALTCFHVKVKGEIGGIDAVDSEGLQRVNFHTIVQAERSVGGGTPVNEISSKCGSGIGCGDE